MDNSERQRREKIQQATFQISEAVHTTEDLDSLYRQIHAIVKCLMPAQNFYISLYDAGAALLRFPYFVDEKEPCPGPLPVETGLTGHVLLTGRALLASHRDVFRHDETGRGYIRVGEREIPYVSCGTQPAQWLGAPMMIKGRPTGVLELFDYQNDQAYGEDEKQVLSFVAEQTALAIERKRAEQALRDSEQKFRALFEATSTGVMIHDEQQYLEVNPAIVRMFGYGSTADFAGKSPAATSPPVQPGGIPSSELARQHIAECVKDGTARFEWLARHANGGDFPVEVILTRIAMGGRQLIQAVVTDISERKRAESGLHQALAREQELGQLKSKFVSMVSHEFRTPLGVIQSSAEILGDYFDQLDSSERREHLLSVVRNTRRMAGLMEEVLVVSQLDAGRMDFKPAPLSLAAFCQRVADEVLAATERRCPIEVKVDDALTGEALADERLLRHIFTNLLSNAVKYSEPGQPARFSVKRAGRDAVATVSDQGIGIPEADRARLFQAFHRGQNVDQRPGTGLGLVIVKRCVELHGGSLSVSNRVGKGTTVTVQLPLFTTLECP